MKNLELLEPIKKESDEFEEDFKFDELSRDLIRK